MAIVLYKNSGADDNLVGVLDGSTAIQNQALLYFDRTNGVLEEATSSAGTTLNLAGVASEAAASGATETEYVPLADNQLWIVDCNADTAADQLHKRHAMTDSLIVNNTSSDVATTLGVFEAYAIKGAASDRQLIGKFLRPGQVTA